MVVEEAPFGWHAVLVADYLQQPWRQVGQAADLKDIVELTQVRQMLDLGDRAAADDTNLETGHWTTI